jgi:hypothetical protein
MVPRENEHGLTMLIGPRQNNFQNGWRFPVICSFARAREDAQILVMIF